MVIFENIDIDIDDAILKNIDINMVIPKNTHIDIDIFRKSLRNICIDKVSTKKNTGLFGNFSQHGGGVFPIPKTKNQKKCP